MTVASLLLSGPFAAHAVASLRDSHPRVELREGADGSWVATGSPDLVADVQAALHAAWGDNLTVTVSGPPGGFTESLAVATIEDEPAPAVDVPAVHEAPSGPGGFVLFTDANPKAASVAAVRFMRLAGVTLPAPVAMVAGARVSVPAGLSEARMVELAEAATNGTAVAFSVLGPDPDVDAG